MYKLGLCSAHDVVMTSRWNATLQSTGMSLQGVWRLAELLQLLTLAVSTDL